MADRERGVANIGSSILAHVHARDTDTNGKVIPACLAYDRAKLQAEVVVTGRVERVTCPACRALVKARAAA